MILVIVGEDQKPDPADSTAQQVVSGQISGVVGVSAAVNHDGAASGLKQEALSLSHVQRCEGRGSRFQQ